MIAVAIFSSGLMVILIGRSTRDGIYQGFRTAVGLRWGKNSFGKLIILPLLSGAGLAFLASWVMKIRQNVPMTPMGEALSSADSSMAIFIFIAVAVILAPLLEEIIFRGYFFLVLDKIKGRAFAIAVITLMFGILHVGQYWGDWLAIVMVALMGLSLTLFRAWTGSTIASAVTHYTYNFVLVIIPVIFFFNLAYLKYQVLYNELDSAQKEELLTQSIRNHPDFSSAYNDLAWLYAKDGKNLGKALKLIEEALRYEPGNEAYLDTKAEVLYMMGRYAEAIAIENSLVEQRPDNQFYKEQLEKFQKGLMGQMQNAVEL